MKIKIARSERLDKRMIFVRFTVDTIYRMKPLIRICTTMYAAIQRMLSSTKHVSLLGTVMPVLPVSLSTTGSVPGNDAIDIINANFIHFILHSRVHFTLPIYDPPATSAYSQVGA